MFEPVMRPIKWEKVLDFALFGNSFSDLFTEFDIWY